MAWPRVTRGASLHSLQKPESTVSSQVQSRVYRAATRTIARIHHLIHGHTLIPLQTWLSTALIVISLLSAGAAATTALAAEPVAPGYATPTASIAAAVASRRLPQAVIDAARKQSEVHVIVELQLPAAYAPEHLLTGGAIEAQRLAIARAQVAVIADTLGLTPKAPQRMRYTPYMSLWGDERALLRLVQSKDVRRLLVNGQRRTTLASSTVATGVAATQNAMGLLGSGQTIAIIDTGVERDHAFLGGRVVSEACYSDSGGWFSGRTTLCPNGAEATTVAGSAAPCGLVGCAHGTHVAGIAAGAATGTTRFSGVASNANIVAIQVFHREDDADDCAPELAAPCLLADDSDVVLAMERVFELRTLFNIAAVNLSLGSGFYTDRRACDDDRSDYRDAVALLLGANIATVAAAGNGAAVVDRDGKLLNFISGIGAPACVSNVLSVGSVSDADLLALGSQFGDLLTMLAPGIRIESSIPGGTFGEKGGTSMAAPHVAGAIAALRGLDPGQSVAAIRDRLTATGVQVADGRSVPNLVRPRLQLDAAVEAQEMRPLPPSQVRMTLRSDDLLAIAWTDNARGETEFRMFATLPGMTAPTRAIVISRANAAGGTIAPLTPNTEYVVTVQACNAAGRCSVASPPVAMRTINPLPSAPSNVRAGAVTTSSIELRWDSASIFPVTQFRVGHDTRGSWTSFSVPANARAYLFTGLAAGRRYNFWVQAVNAAGVSTLVNFGTSTVSAGPPPAAPSDLHICTTLRLEFGCFASSTRLLWSDNAGDETRYEFEWTRAAPGVPLQQGPFSVSVLGANASAFDVLLASGGLYGFRVRACNAGGCSAYSNFVTFTAP